jgi:hypothetical protein
MTTAYMFVYSFSKSGEFRCHDKYYGVVTDDEKVGQLLEDWWAMELNDLNQ